MSIIMAFIIGGILCLIGQLIMDFTPFSITPAHVLVSYVVAGVVLTGLNLYQPLVNIGGAGATIPLTGFGYSLAKGAIEGANERGLLGVLGGGLEATAIGIVAAVVFGFLVALIFNPKG